MKIIIVQPVPKLGEPGDVKSVRPGFARNYLIPQGLAVPATDANLRRQQEFKAKAEALARRERAHAEALAEKIAATPIRCTLKTGERGQAFGSISANDIREKLIEAGIEVSRSAIELAEGIKTTGGHTVTIKLPHHIEAELKVVVTAEQ